MPSLDEHLARQIAKAAPGRFASAYDSDWGWPIPPIGVDPAGVDPAQRLQRQARERDADPVEPLLEAEPVTQGTSTAADPSQRAPLTAPPQRRALIQDGQYLAREQYTLARLIGEGNWALLRMQREHFSRIAEESATAFRELGA